MFKRFLVLVTLLLILAALAVPIFAAPVYQVLPERPLDDLATTAGVAALTALIVGMFFKPLWGTVLSETHRFYKLAMNGTSMVVAVGLAALSIPLVGATYDNVVNLILVGILAGAAAIGGYEAAKGR